MKGRSQKAILLNDRRFVRYDYNRQLLTWTMFPSNRTEPHVTWPEYITLLRENFYSYFTEWWCELDAQVMRFQLFELLPLALSGIEGTRQQARRDPRPSKSISQAPPHFYHVWPEIGCQEPIQENKAENGICMTLLSKLKCQNMIYIPFSFCSHSAY